MMLTWLLRLRCFLTVIATSILTVSCTLPEEVSEPSKRFPVSAELVTFTVGLKFRAQDGLAYAQDERKFRLFLKEFLRRGRSSLVMATTPGTEPAQERALLARVRSEGVRRGSIIVRPNKAPETDSLGATFSFKGYIGT